MNLCPQLMAALNTAFSRKYNSMAQYVLDARPWAPAGREGALGVIGEVAAEDQQFADRIAGVIEEVEGVPQLEIFNPEVANLNYLALDYLLNYLVQDFAGQLADYERSVVLAGECEVSRNLFQALVDATRSQLARLKAV